MIYRVTFCIMIVLALAGCGSGGTTAPIDHTVNLEGTWTGTWTKTNQAVASHPQIDGGTATITVSRESGILTYSSTLTSTAGGPTVTVTWRANSEFYRIAFNGTNTRDLPVNAPDTCSFPLYQTAGQPDRLNMLLYQNDRAHYYRAQCLKSP